MPARPDPFAAVKAGFAQAKAGAAAQGGANAVVQAYHGSLVPPFCNVAARALPAGAGIWRLSNKTRRTDDMQRKISNAPDRRGAAGAVRHGLGAMERARRPDAYRTRVRPPTPSAPCCPVIRRRASAST